MNELVPRTVPIVGRPAEVAMVLARQRELGHLLSDPTALPTSTLGDGRVVVRAVMLVPVVKPLPDVRPRPRADDTWRPIRNALIFSLIVLTLGSVVIAAAILLAGKLLLTLVGIILFAVVLVGIAMGNGTKSDCPGVTTHCPPAHHK